MCRIEIGKQETHRDGLHALVSQVAGRAAHLLLVEGHQHVPLRRDQAFGHHFAVAALDQRAVLPGDFLENRVMLRALMASDVDDVAVSLGRHHASLGALVFEERVGGDGGAVIDVIDRLGRDPSTFAKFQNARHDSHGRIVGRRRDLMDQRLVALGIGVHDVRKGAAHVHANQLHTNLPGAKPPLRGAPALEAKRSGAT